MVMGIDIYSSRELQAAVLGLRRAQRSMQAEVRTQTRQTLLPEWQKGLAERAESKVEHRVLVETGRIKMSNQNVRMSSATVGRKLSGGLNPKTMSAAIEFGADRNKKATYSARSSRGRSFQVTRRTRAQLRSPKRGGYVVYPTAKALIPRFASLWVQTVVRSFHDGIEGK